MIIVMREGFEQFRERGNKMRATNLSHEHGKRMMMRRNVRPTANGCSGLDISNEEQVEMDVKFDAK